MLEVEHLMDITAPLLADLLQHEDLQTFKQAVSHHCNQLFMFDAPLKDPRLQAQLATSLYRDMPLPHRQFKQGVQKKPQRNDPCPCGSGSKYKQCCGLLADIPRLAADDLFAMAVTELKNQTWKKLAEHPDLPNSLRSRMVFVAMEEGKPKKVWQLVSALFDDLSKVTDADQELISIGFDALLDLGYERKRLDYMKAMTELKRHKQVQAMAYQRLAMFSADKSLFEDASHYLEQARRIAPDHFDLPIAELSIIPFLVSDQELRDRARFWQKRIAKLWGDDYPYLHVVNNFAEHGKAATEQMIGLAADDEDDFFYNTESDDSGLEVLAEKVENILLRSMGLFIEGVVKVNGRYHLGTFADQADRLEEWRASWMGEVKTMQRPGTPQEYAAKWQDPDAHWLTLLKMHPQLIGHTTVLLELLEWAQHAPMGAEVFAVDIDEQLRMQRLCLINTVMRMCLSDGIQLDPKAAQNMPLFLHMGHQLTDLIDDEYFEAAEGLAADITAVVKNAKSVIPQLKEV